MKENNFEKDRDFKIETIKSPDNNEVSFCPGRGGIITSVKLKGKEILYLDEETFKDINKNVKGGIPVLFPNAGPITENKDFPNLEQHGFARKSKWQFEKNDDKFEESLSSDEETKKMYPYDFRLSVSVEFEKDGSVTLIEEVENKEENNELPVSMGLHPYFKVSNEDKNKIKFNFEGGKFIEEQVDIWSNGKAISIDNPKIKDPDAIMEVNIPGLGSLIINPSIEYKKIWIWSMSDKNFVCIEPVMRDKNGLIDNPEKIKPKEKFSSKVNIKLIG